MSGYHTLIYIIYSIKILLKKYLHLMLKLLTCYLDLDVSEINIADKIYILGEYWRINKIIDYNANSNDTTKSRII